MVDWRGVRLDRDAILRAQDMEVQRRHDRRQRGGRRLVAPDLQPVDIFADVVGVMDRPTRQPQHFFLERTESGQVFNTDFRRLGHIHVPQGGGAADKINVRRAAAVAKVPLVSAPRLEAPVCRNSRR
jgi:hypothetical protein